MFAERRRRRELISQITEVKGQLMLLNDLNDRHEWQREELRSNLFQLTQGLDTFESNLVMRNARRLALEIPSHDEQPTWWTDNSGDPTVPPNSISRWLSATGRVRVSKLVQEERRKSVEWWVKIVAPILAALISLMGLLVALITVLRNKPRP